MSFAQGRVSFRIYTFSGKTENVVESLLEHTYEASHSPIGEECEVYVCGMSEASEPFGWDCAFGHNEFVLFGIRVDRNDVPPSVKKKLKREAESAIAKNNPSGFISKLQRREAKDAVAKQVEQLVKDRHYNRSKHLPVLIDLQAKRIMATASDASESHVLGLIERALGIEAIRVDVLSLAAKKELAAAESALPTAFCVNPLANNAASYPWVMGTKLFLGTEFLTWLFLIDRRVADEVKGHSVRIDSMIELHCAYGIGGVVTHRGDMPSRSIETTRAFRDGKVVRKMSVVADLGRHGYEFVLDDTLQITGLKMEDILDADTPRAVAESRIALVCNAVDGICHLVDVFIGERFKGEWDQIVAASRRLGDNSECD